jgi:hypothetical protein
MCEKVTGFFWFKMWSSGSCYERGNESVRVEIYNDEFQQR